MSESNSDFSPTHALRMNPTAVFQDFVRPVVNSAQASASTSTVSNQAVCNPAQAFVAIAAALNTASVQTLRKNSLTFSHTPLRALTPFCHSILSVSHRIRAARPISPRPPARPKSPQML